MKPESGRCPVREFLDGLKESDPDDFTIVMAGLAKLRNRQYHKPPLSKPIGEDLFEMRHVGKLNTEGALFFRKGTEDVLQFMGFGAKAKEFQSEILRLRCKEKGLVVKESVIEERTHFDHHLEATIDKIQDYAGNMGG